MDVTDNGPDENGEHTFFPRIIEEREVNDRRENGDKRKDGDKKESDNNFELGDALLSNFPPQEIPNRAHGVFLLGRLPNLGVACLNPRAFLLRRDNEQRYLYILRKPYSPKLH